MLVVLGAVSGTLAKGERLAERKVLDYPGPPLGFPTTPG